MRIVGIDPAFANMGLCSCDVSRTGAVVEVHALKLVSTEADTAKTVRKSSDDLRRAQELHKALQHFCNDHTLAFAEVPSGAQSARASWSLGIALGVIASCPIPVIQVSPIEVKLATIGTKTAKKGEIIAWAVEKFPDAGWLRHAGKLTANNEHLADALAVIYAGIRSPSYTQLSSVLDGILIPRTPLR